MDDCGGVDRNKLEQILHIHVNAGLLRPYLDAVIESEINVESMIDKAMGAC
jgi:hypothetical protein